MSGLPVRRASPPAARRVLGVDPGTRVAGWALLANTAQGAISLVSGTWRLGASELPAPQRLLKLHELMSAVVREHQPTALAIESAFLGPNARSALRLGEARGVVMLAAAAAGLAVEEIPPATVKRRVAGAGAASKEQIERLVRLRLGLGDCSFGSSDESDAVAVALCAWLAGDGRAGGLPASAGIRSRRGRAALPAGARIQA